jgi:hypothetical protein
MRVRWLSRVVETGPVRACLTRVLYVGLYCGVEVGTEQGQKCKSSLEWWGIRKDGRMNVAGAGMGFVNSYMMGQKMNRKRGITHWLRRSESSPGALQVRWCVPLPPLATSLSSLFYSCRRRVLGIQLASQQQSCHLGRVGLDTRNHRGKQSDDSNIDQEELRQHARRDNFLLYCLLSGSNKRCRREWQCTLWERKIQASLSMFRAKPTRGFFIAWSVEEIRDVHVPFR